MKFTAIALLFAGATQGLKLETEVALENRLEAETETALES